MIQVSDLTTPATPAQIQAGWEAQLEALQIPITSWPKGGVARTILAVFAITIAGFTNFIASWVAGNFLPTSSGTWLKLLAKYVYGVTPTQATFAQGFLTLTNTGGGLYEYGAGQVTVKSSATGKSYTLGAFTLNPMQTLTGIAATAIEAGSASSAPPGGIDTLVTTMNGVTVTNPASVVGLDAQSDASIQAACYASIPALSPNGPAGAYAFAIINAKEPDGVTPVNINRYSISPFSSTGQVTIAVASPAGAASSTDIASVQAAIEASFEKDVATVTVSAAVPVALTSAITVWATPTVGLSSSALAAMVATAITNYVASYPIGGIAKPPSTQGYLYASALDGVAKGAHPSIYAVDGLLSDIALSSLQVATMAATVTANVAAS